MSDEKFTPGPWKVDINKSGDVWVIDEKENDVACVFGGSWTTKDQDEVNASLIAAAPDMYEALTLVCGDCSERSDWEDIFTIGAAGAEMPPCPCGDCYVYKALKKARGDV